jgi:alkanesulfonate monooxygenase SsuD/methylene tetrahydromethanopterin reductase-like flavin-dependent oxidoreductase (luciferase family)
MPALPHLRLGVALDGAGWHPAAWRSTGARPDELFTPGYWVDLFAEAERATVDFVTIDDSLGIQSARWRTADDHVDQVRGRLDAVLVAARVAPTTSHVGIIPTATTTHTEPFHVSKAIATLDWVSGGRAGVQVRVSGTPVEAAQVGRRSIPGAPITAELFDEAADFVEVLRRLWDSWEDDAEIRDAATGRFIDRDKLHYIDFEGRWFSVKGPSITPRPPQGQPVVAALAHATGAATRSWCSPTWWCSSTTSRARPANAWRVSTPSTAGPTAPTPWSSPAPRASWPTCCWHGRPPSPPVRVWPGSGSGPGRSPTTSR